MNHLIASELPNVADVVLQGEILDQLNVVHSSIGKLTEATAILYRRRAFQEPGTDELENRVKTILKLRTKRAAMFHSDLFGEPAWDMLLELYALKLADKRESVSGLCIASGVPPSTALRWIGILETNGWITREPDPLDRRRAYVSLSPRSETAMESFFAQPELTAGL